MAAKNGVLSQVREIWLITVFVYFIAETWKRINLPNYQECEEAALLSSGTRCFIIVTNFLRSTLLTSIWSWLIIWFIERRCQWQWSRSRPFRKVHFGIPHADAWLFVRFLLHDSSSATTTQSSDINSQHKICFFFILICYCEKKKSNVDTNLPVWAVFSPSIINLLSDKLQYITEIDIYMLFETFNPKWITHHRAHPFCSDLLHWPGYAYPW